MAAVSGLLVASAAARWHEFHVLKWCEIDGWNRLICKWAAHLFYLSFWSIDQISLNWFIDLLICFLCGGCCSWKKNWIAIWIFEYLLPGRRVSLNRLVSTAPPPPPLLLLLPRLPNPLRGDNKEEPNQPAAAAATTQQFNNNSRICFQFFVFVLNNNKRPTNNSTGIDSISTESS